MFAVGKPFQDGIVFVATHVKHVSGAPLNGRLLALPTNNRLGWKGFPGENTLAYRENFVTYCRKKFYNIYITLLALTTSNRPG